MKAYITGVECFLPNDPVSNDEMESVLGMAGSRPSRARRTILRSNGIKTRYYAIDPKTGKQTHTNAKMTAEAIRKLENSNFSLNDLDCLVCGTTLPDQLMPNHAVMVHGELKCPPAEVVATAGICVTGITALKYAYMAVKCNEHKRAVATGSELVSSSMRGHLFEPELQSKVDNLEKQGELAFEKDFLRWMLSDGAGAVLIEPEPNAVGLSLEINWIHERSYANEFEACMYGGATKREDGSLQGWREHMPASWLENSIFAIKQDVKLLNENIVKITVEQPLSELRDSGKLNPDEIDHFLPHHSSMYFREKLYEGMQNINCVIPYDKWFTNLTTCGNTGSASFYIMLEEMVKSGKLKNGEKILGYIPESGRFSSAFILMTVNIN